jgi:hypothetical protein
VFRAQNPYFSPTRFHVDPANVLAELRQIYGAYSDDVAVTGQFSAALALMFVELRRQGEIAHCAFLLDEMRRLPAIHSDAEVRLRFATMLLMACEGSCPIVTPEIFQPLDELAGLSRKHPDDAAVRKAFVEALSRVDS